MKDVSIIFTYNFTNHNTFITILVILKSMSEHANYDASIDENGTNNPINSSDDRKLIFQILITFSLIIGPIFLPFIFLFPSSFSWFPSAKESSIIVVVLFLLSSILYAILKSK